MTNSAAAEGTYPGKRERLVESARDLFHSQGVHRTTLAEVAERADVPLGNVYYYFKSRDDLITAVLDCYQEQAATLIQAFERHRSPEARLKALARSWADMSEVVAQHGCPMGSLCTELDKTDDGHDRDAAAAMALLVDWAEGQFRLLGERDARDLAMTLFARIQGAALLANTFRDPTILTGQTRHLEQWIDALARE